MTFATLYEEVAVSIVDRDHTAIFMDRRRGDPAGSLWYMRRQPKSRTRVEYEEITKAMSPKSPLDLYRAMPELKVRNKKPSSVSHEEPRPSRSSNTGRIACCSSKASSLYFWCSEFILWRGISSYGKLPKYAPSRSTAGRRWWDRASKIWNGSITLNQYYICCSRRQLISIICM